MLIIPFLETVRVDLSTFHFSPRAMLVQEKDDRISSAAPTLRESHACRLRIQFIVLCFSLFLAGWNDGSTGPLLLRIQNVYHVCAVICTLKLSDYVRFTVVSLLWVFACTVSTLFIMFSPQCYSIRRDAFQGFISGALINVPLSAKWGFGRVSDVAFLDRNDRNDRDNHRGYCKRVRLLF